jgi:hypothetical protein
MLSLVWEAEKERDGVCSSFWYFVSSLWLSSSYSESYSSSCSFWFWVSSVHVKARDRLSVEVLSIEVVVVLLPGRGWLPSGSCELLAELRVWVLEICPEDENAAWLLLSAIPNCGKAVLRSELN